MKTLCPLAIFLCSTLPALAAGSSPVAPGAMPVRLVGDCKFTEGPTANAAGDVFFTDQPNDRILKWSAAGVVVATFLQPAGRSNGMCFNGRGHLIACADEKNELWSIAPDGTVTVLLRKFGGRPFNGPNDVWVHPSGGMYFTDPFYRRTWWKHDAPPQGGQHVYLLPAGAGAAARRVAEDLAQPNGIVGTPDGTRLFVADLGAKKTYRFDIKPDGALSGKTLVCEMGSDGMTLDEEGNLYLTGKGVFVFDRAGTRIAHIEVPEKWCANVCFGGRDRRTLFITATTGLYSLAMRVRGAGPAK